VPLKKSGEKKRNRVGSVFWWRSIGEGECREITTARQERRNGGFKRFALKNKVNGQHAQSGKGGKQKKKIAAKVANSTRKRHLIKVKPTVCDQTNCLCRPSDRVAAATARLKIGKWN